MKYVCTDGRKKGRKAGRQAEDKPFRLHKTDTEFCLYITTIPKDPWSFLLFNKKNYLFVFDSQSPCLYFDYFQCISSLHIDLKGQHLLFPPLLLISLRV